MNDEFGVPEAIDFEIVVEKEPEDEGYLAYAPILPGCFSNGRTVEEARRNIGEAIQQHLVVLKHHQWNSIVQYRSCSPGKHSNDAPSCITANT